MAGWYDLAHLVGGLLALGCSFLALLSRHVPTISHRHRTVGELFFAFMTVFFLVSLVRHASGLLSLWLLIAALGYYFAWMGRKLAKNPDGHGEPTDFLVVGAVGLAGFGLFGKGLHQVIFSGFVGLPWLIVGMVVSGQAVRDWINLRRSAYTGRVRILAHMTMMLAASTSVGTVLLAEHVPGASSFAIWALPALVFAPFYVIWSQRISRGDFPPV